MMEAIPSTSKGFRGARENFFGSGLPSFGDKTGVSRSGVSTSRHENDQEKQKAEIDKTVFDDEKLNAMLPWLKHYCTICLANVGVTAHDKIEKLMHIFKECVQEMVKSSLKKPSAVVCIRILVANFMKFFYIGYIKSAQPLNRDTYLNLMSDLLGLNLDLEIKAAEAETESASKIASRIIICLHLYLDNSLQHMIDVFLKANLVKKASQKICAAILSKLLDFDNLPPGQKHWMLYVRYVLAFKIYKRLLNEAKDKTYVSQLVIKKLPAPVDFEKSMAFSMIFPEVSAKGKKDITAFLINTKFDIKESIQKFLTNYVRDVSLPPNVKKKSHSAAAAKPNNEGANKHAACSVSNSKKPGGKKKKTKVEKLKIKSKPVNKKNIQKRKESYAKQNEERKPQKKKKKESFKEVPNITATLGFIIYIKISVCDHLYHFLLGIVFINGDLGFYGTKLY